MGSVAQDVDRQQSVKMRCFYYVSIIFERVGSVICEIIITQWIGRESRNTYCKTTMEIPDVQEFVL